MKFAFGVLAALVLLGSCASLKPLPDSTLEGKAVALLDGPSTVDPVQVKMAPDYSLNRWTLVRTYITQTINGHTSTSPAPDHVMGLDLGNGIFLDANGNLSVRFDPLVGVSDTFRGRTEYSYHLTNDEKTTVRVTTFGDGSISVVDPAPLFLARKDTIDTKAKKISVAGVNLEFKDKDHVSITPGFTLSPFDGRTYETVVNGVKRTWWDSFLGLIPFINSDTYMLSNNVVVDSDKSFVVEGAGSYERVAFTKGNQFSFRIYRTATKYLVLDEATGQSSFLATRSDNSLEWSAKLVGVLGIVTDKVVQYAVKSFPDKP